MPRSIRLYTDENIDANLAPALVELGFDALSCHAAGNANLGLSDYWQLEWAANEGRAILTIDAPDFTRLARLWIVQNRTHSGILFVRWMTLGDLIRATSAFLDRYTAEDLDNVTMWVS